MDYPDKFMGGRNATNCASRIRLEDRGRITGPVAPGSGWPAFTARNHELKDSGMGMGLIRQRPSAGLGTFGGMGQEMTDAEFCASIGAQPT